MNIFQLLEYESKIEDLALNFLKEVDINPQAVVSSGIHLSLIKIIKDKSEILTKINCLGNLGLALRSILTNNMIAPLSEDGVAIVVNSYYCISKHINDIYMPNHQLLFINRALLIYENIGVFNMKNKSIENLSKQYKVDHIILSLVHKELSLYVDYESYVKVRFCDLESLILSEFGFIVQIDDNLFDLIHREYYCNVELMVKEIIKIQ
jgi:hypothetical protein